MKANQPSQPKKRNRFLEPILKTLNWTELYFFIVLLGLVPAISDYSLFLPVGGSHLDFLLKEPAILYIVIAALLPIGLFICIKKRSFWMLIGLLPIISGVTFKLIYYFTTIQEETSLFALIMFIAYKLAFFYFVFKGHLRSLSFLAILIFIGVFQPTLQLVSFGLFSLVCRMAYLAISQNLSILAVLKPKNLIRLSFKTLLAWSPILLFAVPSYMATKYLNQEVKQQLYDNTFLKSYQLHTTKKIEDLMDYPIQKSLLENDLSDAGHEKSQQHLNNILRVVKFRSDSLGYEKDYKKGVDDFKELYLLYQDAYNAKSPYASNWFVAEHTSWELEKVLINKFLPGRSEFELDINLSINEKYEQDELIAKNKADSINLQLQKKLDAKITATNKKMDEMIAKSRSLEARSRNAVGAQQEALLAEAKATSDAIKTSTNGTINDINASVKQDIDAIPGQANNMFAKAVPTTLVGVSPGFKNSSCGFLEVKCYAFNLVKSLLRSVYKEQREKARIGVDASANRLKDKANAKLNKTTNAATNEVNQSIAATEAKITALTNASASNANNANTAAFAEINHSIVTSAETLKNQLIEIKKTTNETNREVKSGLETGYRGAKETTRQVLLTAYKAIFYFGLFSNILLGILIIKSYFYVFSRITFSEKSNVYVDIKDNPKTFENGVLTECNTEYSIPIDNSESMYLSRKYIPTGRAPKVAIPRWTNGIVSRIRNGVYLMNEVTVRENETESVDFRSVAGAEFVEWNLSEGEEVVFNYKDLVAMSDTLTLSSYISFRLTSLFFGRSIFHIAKGPGKLVLRTHGKPITNHEEHLVKSVHIDRIIAWQRTTQFSIDSELSMVNMYFSGVYLKRTNDDLIVIDADAGNTKRKVGLAKFVTKFLLPI